MRPRSASLALVVVALVLVAAGCGSSKKKSSAPPATTAASQTTTAAATKVTPAVKGGATNCVGLSALSVKFSQAMAAATASAHGDPAKQAQNTAKLYLQFASAAPAEIRPDFMTFAKAMSTYAGLLAKVHMKPGKVPSAADMATLQKATRTFSAPDFAQAAAHITAWAKANCPNFKK